MTLAVGDLVADYAWTHPAPEQIAAAGIKGVMRYLSGDPSKNITLHELQALHAAGLAVGLVWEFGASDVLGGPQAGKVQGLQANAMADALGWPGDLPIYYATDFDAQPDQFFVISGYHQAAGAAGRPAGSYGSLSVVAAMLDVGAARYAWQTSAWSRGATLARAHLYQRIVHTVTIPGVSPGAWDENVVMNIPAGLWEPDGPAPTLYAALSGQEAGPMNASTAPDGLRQDMVWVGPDGHIYHAWSDPNGAFAFPDEDRGPTPDGGRWQYVSATYRKDGIYTVYGTDEHGHIWTTRSNGTTWIQPWAPVNQAWQVAGAPAGPPGPPGPPGPAGASTGGLKAGDSIVVAGVSPAKP